jgi:hypothetical protein
MNTSRDYSHQNLQKASFRNEDLSNARFTDSDLRGADFTGADLTGTDLTHVKTGIPTANRVWLFLAALVVSLFSGYIAMLAGQTVQTMLASTDDRLKIAGIASLVMTVIFIVYVYLKGGGNAIKNLIIPAVGLSLVIGIIFKLSGLGSGLGMYYLILTLLLLVAMFIVGTVARAAAGTLSSTILFIIVAMGGAMFGKSVGGGIGTVILAISCVLISKKALSGAKGFEGLQKVARYITTKFGTSFRNARLSGANFSQSKISNADFSNADVSLVNWGDSKKTNCITTESGTTLKA